MRSGMLYVSLHRQVAVEVTSDLGRANTYVIWLYINGRQKHRVRLTMRYHQFPLGTNKQDVIENMNVVV